MRLIDADALNKHIFENVPVESLGGTKVMGLVRTLIDDAPTVDAMPTSDHFDTIKKLYDRIETLATKNAVLGYEVRKLERELKNG